MGRVAYLGQPEGLVERALGGGRALPRTLLEHGWQPAGGRLWAHKSLGEARFDARSQVRSLAALTRRLQTVCKRTA